MEIDRHRAVSGRVPSCCLLDDLSTTDLLDLFARITDPESRPAIAHWQNSLLPIVSLTGVSQGDAQ
jgi:hypothetical protein